LARGAGGLLLFVSQPTDRQRTRKRERAKTRKPIRFGERRTRRRTVPSPVPVRVFALSRFRVLRSEPASSSAEPSAYTRFPFSRSLRALPKRSLFLHRKMERVPIFRRIAPRPSHRLAHDAESWYNLSRFLLRGGSSPTV